MLGPAGELALEDGEPRGEQGRESPVVLLHSLAGNSTHWSKQLEHLRRTRRAVALDLRGHGGSEPPKNGDYSITGMVGDVAAAVDTLGLKSFVLVGHSMGGGVALAYAGQHPERVAGLVLVDPIGDGKQIPAAEAQSFLSGLESSYDSASTAYWTSIAGAESAVRDRLLEDLRRTPEEAVIQGLRSVMQFDPDPALASFAGPKLSVVTPHNDMPFSLHRLGNGFPHVVVEGTGHWIQLDKPEEFNRLLDDFLDNQKREQ